MIRFHVTCKNNLYKFGKLSVKSQRGTINIKRYSGETQKCAITVQI